MKKGGRLPVLSQVETSPSTLPRARKSAIRLRTQPAPRVLWPTPGTVTCRLWGRWRAASSPQEGGVTGSSSPLKSSTGTLDDTGVR